MVAHIKSIVLAAGAVPVPPAMLNSSLGCQSSLPAVKWPCNRPPQGCMRRNTCVAVLPCRRLQKTIGVTPMLSQPLIMILLADEVVLQCNAESTLMSSWGSAGTAGTHSTTLVVLQHPAGPAADFPKRQDA